LRANARSVQWRHISGREAVAARRRIAAALGAIGLLVGLFPAPVALAADPAAGFSANWTVTPPAGVTRAADSIAVGDDFSVWFAAVDVLPHRLAHSTRPSAAADGNSAKTHCSVASVELVGL